MAKKTNTVPAPDDDLENESETEQTTEALPRVIPSEEMLDRSPDLAAQQAKLLRGQSRDLEELIDFCSSLDETGAKLTVRRKGPFETNYAFCFTTTPKDFSYDNIKNVWGGGDYKVVARDSGGKYFANGSFSFSIDPRCKGTMDAKAESAAPLQTQDALVEKLVDRLTAVQKPDSGKSSAEMIAGMFAESQKTLAAAITAASAPRPQMDFIGLIAALSPMVVAVINRPAPAQTGLKDMLEGMKAIKEISGDNPPDEDESMMGKILKYGGPAIGSLLGTVLGGNRQNAQEPMQAQVVSEPAAQQLPPAQPEYAKLVEMLNMYSPLLLQSARKGTDPNTVAALIEDNAEPEVLDQLIGLLRREDWLAAIFANNANVLANRAWFESLRQALIEPPADDTPEANPAPSANVQ